MYYENEFAMLELSAHIHCSAGTYRILSHAQKVIDSCVKMEQLENARNWAVRLINNLYNRYSVGWFVIRLTHENDRVVVLNYLEAAYRYKAIEIERDDLSEKDALFIQEIINDLERNGYRGGSKAQTMLFDWSGELRNKSGLIGQRKKVFFEKVGRENW